MKINDQKRANGRFHGGPGGVFFQRPGRYRQCPRCRQFRQ